MNNEELLLKLRHRKNKEGYSYLMDKEQIDICIEALEKQVAKKLTHEATIQKCHTCPNCKNVLDRFDKTLYCMFCGQKIDWSEADE